MSDNDLEVGKLWSPGRGIMGPPPNTILLLACLFLIVSACTTPVGVKRIDPRTVHRALTASVISADTLSNPTRNVLSRRDLFARFENDLINILKAYPATEVRLEGHTDSTGDSEENKKLSQARAEAVKESLVKGGIDASRITTAGFGQEKPIVSNDTEDGRAKNRRLELVVAKK